MRSLSLVVSDLRSEAKVSRFEFGCYLCAEVSSLQQSPSECLSVYVTAAEMVVRS